MLFSSPIWSQDLVSSAVSINTNDQVEVNFKSDQDSYYLLQSKFNNKTHFVGIALGNGNEIKLIESAKSQAVANYQVFKFAKSKPADADNDGIDDLKELASYSLFNSGLSIPFNQGVLSIIDHNTFKQLSFKGKTIDRDAHLNDLEYVKFTILGNSIENSEVYFINTENFNSHEKFRNAAKINSFGSIGVVKPELRGELIYHPNLKSPNGKLGLYRFQFQPSDEFTFEKITLAYEVLCRNMPFLKNNLGYYPAGEKAQAQLKRDIQKFNSSRVPILSDSEIFGEAVYLAYNLGESYGFLKFYDENKTVNQSDILILNNLPNEISRTSGFISLVPQTPLSHVNLVAQQDGVPNAFVKNADTDEYINSLVNSYVHYVVTQQGILFTPTTEAEVIAWQKLIKPSNSVEVRADLTAQRILSLKLIGFEDWTKYGVKCANLATMKTFGFEPETIPSGFGVPFYFYNEFMKHNGFYDEIKTFLQDSSFIISTETREKSLKSFRKKIEKGGMPEWMLQEFSKLQSSFPPNTPIRCRSSTNNEDLPFFSGAGLYSSKTHNLDEGHLSKTIKEVYASLWNLRAFEAREFYNIDHFSIFMGVLCHPNQKDEKVNGVAVSCDPFYFHPNVHYLNNQMGEDLVTNPEEFSKAEELLVDMDPKTKDSYIIVSNSSKSPDKLLLSDKQIDDLRNHLSIILRNFNILYEVKDDQPFAIEVEYKITKENKLLIKQARPWLGTISSSSNIDLRSVSTFQNPPKFLPVQVTIFPNPVEDVLNLKYAVPEEAEIEISIINNKGQVLQKHDIGNQELGNYNFEIPKQTFTNQAGIFYLKISQKGKFNKYLSTSKFFIL